MAGIEKEKKRSNPFSRVLKISYEKQTRLAQIMTFKGILITVLLVISFFIAIMYS
jgi:hypothetical protein